MVRRIKNLISVEFMKITRQRLFFIALFLITLTVVLSVLLEPSEGKKSSSEELGTTSETVQKLAHRPDGGFGPLIRGCKNGFALAAIFILIFSALSIATETTSGTIRMVLTRPIRRSELFLAKALTLIIIAIIIILLIEILSFAISYLAYGLSHVTDATYPDTPFPQGAKVLMIRYTLYSFIMVAFPLIAIIFFGLFISSFVENVGIAIALAILIYLSFDYIIIGLFDKVAPYLFSYYHAFYLDRLYDLSGAIADSNWAFKVIDEWIGLGKGEIKTSALYPEWQLMVIKSIIVPIGYIIVFTIPSLIILRRKDILV